jgi:hypothetical protein
VETSESTVCDGDESTDDCGRSWHKDGGVRSTPDARTRSLKAWRWAFTEVVLGHHRGIVVQVEAGLALPLFSLVVEMDGRDRVSMQSHTSIWA